MPDRDGVPGGPGYAMDPRSAHATVQLTGLAEAHPGDLDAGVLLESTRLADLDLPPANLAGAELVEVALDAVTGQISGTPGAGDAGVSNVVVTATEDTGAALSVDGDFTLTVTEAPGPLIFADGFE